jgi:hypothetical protein
MPELIYGQEISGSSDLNEETTGIDPSVTVTQDGYQDEVDFTLAGSGSSQWFDTRTVDTVVLIATGTAKFYCVNSDFTITRELTMSGQVQTATATKCGFVCQDAMPPLLRVTDTSGSSNPCTIRFKRRNRSGRVVS